MPVRVTPVCQRHVDQVAKAFEGKRLVEVFTGLRSIAYSPSIAPTVRNTPNASRSSLEDFTPIFV